MMQKYSSKATSINAKRIPAIYNSEYVKTLITGKTVIDIGGGKYDNTVEKFKDICHIEIYDKYNRTEEHNKKVLRNHYDFAIISNVLNVIAEYDVRKEVIEMALKYSNITFIKVYEGNGSGIGKQTGADQYQLNRKTDTYIGEISEMFPNITIRKHGNIIQLN